MTYRILLVSDNVTTSKQIAKALRIADYDITVIHSAEKAKTVIVRKFDLIILDTDFAISGEGWILAKMLREMPDGADVGVIMLAKSSSYRFIKDPEYANVYDYVLSYPVSHEELIESINRAAKKYSK